MMRSQATAVRPGHEQDLPAVFALVRELAEYERAPEQVITSLDDYRDGLRGGAFELLVAERGTETVGMMLFYPVFSTWKGPLLYLEDFVVAERARRTGTGERLWEALLNHAKAEGYRGLRWQVLDWNEPAKSFYRKVGASLDAGWENGLLLW